MADGKLFSGQTLWPEQTLVSPGGRAHLHYQGDGNLVVYLDGTPFWASHTDGLSAGSLKMRADGDLVVADADGNGLAHTRTAGHPRAMVQLQDDGNFVLYEDPSGPQAGTPIWASSNDSFVVEVVEPEPRVVPAHPIRGVLDLVDGGASGLRDAGGRRLVVGLHAGSLLSEAKNRGWNGVFNALDYAAARDYQFVRTWTNLPAPEWWGVAPRPGTFSAADADHESIVRTFSRELVKRDLRWLVSQGDLMWLWPGNRARLCDYMAWLGRVLQQEGGAERLVVGVDAGNEAWNFTRCYDPVLMGAMLDAFLRECPVPIRSMTSAVDEGSLNEFAGPPVSITDKHGSRAYYRMAIERSFSSGYWSGKEHPLVIDSEMPGCGPKVSATNHPEEWMEPEVMGMLAFTALISHQVPVVLSSPGVYLGDETFEQYDALLSLAPRIAAMLPSDVQGWRLFHGGDGRYFSPQRVLRAAPEVPGTWRCDHARADDGRVAVLIYCDEPTRLDLEAINGFEGEIVHPGTLERSPISFAKGQVVPIDLRRGRVLIGRVV